MDGDDGFMQDTIDLNRHRVSKTDTMINPKTRAIHDYWNTLRGGRLAPLRSDIDPRKMPCDVRNVFILEAISTGNIRFRVAGSAIVEAFGMELRGMNARSIMASESRESFSALLNEALEDPAVGYARLVSPRDPEIVWEISLLPLRSDYGTIDRLMGVLTPVSGRSRRRSGPLQFRIDTMQVDSISPTVLDTGRPSHVPGFAETLTRFHRDDAGNTTAGGDTERRPPSLRSIEGGLDQTEPKGPRTVGHLKLVNDPSGHDPSS